MATGPRRSRSSNSLKRFLRKGTSFLSTLLSSTRGLEIETRRFSGLRKRIRNAPLVLLSYQSRTSTACAPIRVSRISCDASVCRYRHPNSSLQIAPDKHAGNLLSRYPRTKPSAGICRRTVDGNDQRQTVTRTKSTRFQKNARKTRAAVSELVGRGVRLMATDDPRELVVCCGLGSTTLPRTRLSHFLYVVRSKSRGDYVRWREESVD